MQKQEPRRIRKLTSSACRYKRPFPAGDIFSAPYTEVTDFGLEPIWPVRRRRWRWRLALRKEEEELHLLHLLCTYLGMFRTQDSEAGRDALLAVHSYFLLF